MREITEWESKVNQWQDRVLNIAIVVTYVLYIVIVMGVSKTAPKYLEWLQTGMKIYISMFLVWRFNGWRKVKYTYLDRRIAFNAGILLIVVTVMELWLGNGCKKEEVKKVESETENQEK